VAETWIEVANRQPGPSPEPPPRTGKGSSKAAWAEYARQLGHTVTDKMTRAEIIRLADSGPAPGPNRQALEVAIRALATGPEHAAEVQACRHLADQVDEVLARGGFDEKAWREYRLALKSLREAVADGDSDPIQEAIERLRNG